MMQEWIFGQTMDEEGFEYVDANNDGQIDGEEAANALEQLMEMHTKEDDHVEKEVQLIFCACDDIERDGELSLDEFMGEVCETILGHAYGYEVNEDDFNAVDANGDGKISVDEVMNAMNSMETRSLKEFYFSDNGNIFNFYDLQNSLR